MKTRNYLQVLFFVIVVMGTPINAQEALNRLFERCEQLDYVDMNIVEHRSSSTKKLTQRVTTISFKDHPELVTDFLDAFEKDKPDATQVISHKRNNKIVPTFFTFTVDGARVSFSYSDTDSNTHTHNFSVTRIENGK